MPDGTPIAGGYIRVDAFRPVWLTIGGKIIAAPNGADLNKFLATHPEIVGAGYELQVSYQGPNADSLAWEQIATGIPGINGKADGVPGQDIFTGPGPEYMTRADEITNKYRDGPKGAGYVFQDNPTRPYANVPASGGQWSGELSLMQTLNGVKTPVATFTWGYTLPSGAKTAIPSPILRVNRPK